MRSRRRRRAWRWAFALAGAAFVVTGAFAARDALAIRADLQTGRNALKRARDAAVALDVARLGQALDDATPALARAERRSQSPVWRLLGTVPLLGRSTRAVAHVARAGRLGAEAASEGLQAARAFPARAGRISYGVRDGRIEIEPWIRAQPVLRRAVALIAQAETAIAAAPSSWTLGSVAEATREVAEGIGDLAGALRSTEAASRLLPSMLGADQPRRYLLVVQNPAEARATGGLIGGFATIEVRDGRIRLRASAPNVEVPDPPRPVPMPRWFRERYDRFASRQQWNTANMDPDFRVTGELLAKMWHASMRERVDGVFATDAVALARLLEVTGPVPGPLGHTLRAETFPRLAMSDLYRLIDDRLARKEFLEDSAVRIWTRLLAGVDARGAGEALGDAARARRLMIWSPDAGEQRALAVLRLDGALPTARNFVGITTQNAAGNKIDYYLHRTLDVRVQLGDEASASGTIRIGLSNQAPAMGAPRVVLGPYGSRDRPGTNRMFLSVYLPKDARLNALRLNGQDSTFESSVTPTAVVISRHVELPRGTKTTVEVTWTQKLPVDRARAPVGFTVLAQPIPQRDRVSLSIRASAGAGLETPGRRRPLPELSKRTTASEPLDATFMLRRSLWQRLVRMFS